MTLNGIYRWPLLAAMGLLVVAALADVAGQAMVRDGLADLSYVALILGVALAVPAFVRGPTRSEAAPDADRPDRGGLAPALSGTRGRIADRLRKRPRT